MWTLFILFSFKNLHLLKTKAKNIPTHLAIRLLADLQNTVGHMPQCEHTTHWKSNAGQTHWGQNQCCLPHGFIWITHLCTFLSKTDPTAHHILNKTRQKNIILYYVTKAPGRLPVTLYTAHTLNRSDKKTQARSQRTTDKDQGGG